VAENQYRLEPTDEKSAEKLFDRRWALTVLDQARARLRAEYVRAGKTGFYESLAVLEAGGPDTPSYAEVATQLGATESAVKSALFRLRQRYRELVREGIAQTVADPAEIDEEIRYLIAVVGG
jgi:hypothetical protein